MSIVVCRKPSRHPNVGVGQCRLPGAWTPPCTAAVENGRPARALAVDSRRGKRGRAPAWRIIDRYSAFLSPAAISAFSPHQSTAGGLDGSSCVLFQFSAARSRHEVASRLVETFSADREAAPRRTPQHRTTRRACPDARGQLHRSIRRDAARRTSFPGSRTMPASCATRIAHWRTMCERGSSSPPQAEWLLDNFYLVTSQITDIRRDLPRTYFRELPTLASREHLGQARIYAVALEILRHSDSRSGSAAAGKVPQ